MSCATLTAGATGGSGAPYTYAWSTGATTQSIKVCPTSTTTYTLTVTDKLGCSTTDEVTVVVVDVHCGNKNDRVVMCNNGQLACVAPNAVANLLKNSNWRIGPCPALKK